VRAAARTVGWSGVLLAAAACLGPVGGPTRPASDPEWTSSPVAVESPPAVPSAGPSFQFPLEGARVLSPFGRRGRKFHTGVDLAHSRRGGEPVKAAAAGVVAVLSRRGGYGFMVLIKHDGGWCTRYAHLRGFVVKAGQVVGAGQILGFVGGTGHATAPHLHFEVLTPNRRPVDPAVYLKFSSRS
jgi:murein DD-endopeptidase MepM/ murein hydrolase activator NlpD